MTTLSDISEFLFAVREYLEVTSVEYENNATAATFVEKVRFQVFKDMQRQVAPWQ